MNYNKIIEELRNKFIIIGLTGAIGSGCSETARFLSKSEEEVSFENILNCNMKNKQELINDFDDLEPYRLKRLAWFYKKHKWKKFKTIKVSNILFSIFLFEILKRLKKENLSYNKFSYNKFYEELKKENVKIKLKEEGKCIEIDIINIFKNLKNNKDVDNIIDNINDLIIVKEIKEYKNKKSIQQKLNKIDSFVNNYVNKNKEFFKLFQHLGKEIREENTEYENKILKNVDVKKELSLENTYSKFIIPEIIRRIIQILRDEDEENQFFVIDALRDIFEIEFFKNRYHSFYLFSILANEHNRKERILNNFRLGIEEYKEIKNFETEVQKINDCVGRGDVFINNNFNSPYREKLFYQLLKYIALIRKPGLFTPTKDERFMQVAITARYSSGCISRQVGAVVVGEDGYIRGFGWNDVPEDHIPCVYRTVNELISCDDERMFSEYERSIEFINFIKKKYFSKRLDLPFCFKDIQNKKELEEQKDKIKSNIQNENMQNIEKIIEELKCKNPTRERALHAEENAFLQVSKIGGMTVKNGTLYTTDSPCQLCAKKSMQLKIKRIVYIDAYPDISITHTLQSGPKEERPKFDMFKGVSREAYFKLYTPIIGRKTEINN